MNAITQTASPVHTRESSAPLAVNYHVIKACNAHCEFCFANFPHMGRRDELSRPDQERLVDMLVDAGFGKINFAGGEPTLVKHLGALCERVKKRSGGDCAVSIVTNGKRLGRLIDEAGQWIDWVALSIDSGKDAVNAALGRTRGGVLYAEGILSLGDTLRRRGIGLKLNTVVNRLNVDEDMTAFVRRLAPGRWKLFQVLPVAGENDHGVADLEIRDDEFEAFVERHRSLRRDGIAIVPESNELMTNSYLMISPDGRFFWHEPCGGSRGSKYGDRILAVGLDAALAPARFSADKFRNRGGVFDWLGTPSAPAAGFKGRGRRGARKGE